MVQILKNNAVICANCGNAYFESEGKCPRCGKIYEKGEISNGEREFQKKFDEINNAIRAEQLQGNKYSSQNPYPSEVGGNTDIASKDNK